MDEIIEGIIKNRSVSIIGMGKNVGKTTVLNYLINKTKGKIALGLTSIGRDGETEDIVTSTSKPKIYVYEGTVIGTAKNLLMRSCITYEVIESTHIKTPMGKIIIVKALSSGYIEIGGASINEQTKTIINKMRNLGSELIIVDGAICKKTTSSPLITNSTILCTGGAISNDVNKVVEDTINTIKLLTMKKANDNIRKTSYEILEKSDVGIIDNDNNVKNINIKTALGNSKIIIDETDENSKYIVIKGVVVESILEDFMKSGKCRDVKIVVLDGTKLFINKEVLNKFEKKCKGIEVLEKINVCLIAVNPTSPNGNKLNGDEVIMKLRKRTNVPVIDVCREGDTN